MDSVVSKKEFADLAGVTQGRVSQWLAGRKIYGDAIVGHGHRARIKVPVALEQLKKTLDVDQRLSGNARARLNGSPVDDTLEDKIKAERLRQIELSNSKARIEAAARSGRYILAEDARQEMGRIAGRMMSIFEASLSEFANAVVTKPPGSPRDALLVLRSTWREIRTRQAQGLAAEAAGMPSTVEDGNLLVNPERMALEAISGALMPPPPIDYLAFAEDHVVVDGPFAGPYNRALFPFFDEILRALSPDDPCRIVTLMSSAQCGKTTMANIFALGAMTLGQGAFLVAHPTEDAARRWSRMKLSPLMRSTAIVREMFPPRARDSADAVFYKERKDGLSSSRRFGEMGD